MASANPSSMLEFSELILTNSVIVDMDEALARRLAQGDTEAEL